MTRTASRPASPRALPQRRAQQRLAQRTRQQRLRQAADVGQPPLLQDKLRIPRLMFEVLRRRRVTDLIESAAARRVTVLTGPAGAGKTVACAAWAAARPAARQPAWVTADAGDREPARFWPYVLAALVRARAVAPDDAAELAAAPPEDYPLRLVTAARSPAGPVVLVIDDVHELAGSATLAGLEVLIKHAPPGLRLVLSGRCPPGVALSRLRVAGEVADIGAADLACTPEEADAYLAVLGIVLAPAQRAELLSQTEGWMAGLRLAVMSGPGDAGALAPAVIDYVRDEVLESLGPQTRAFLLKTSVVASVSGGLADALTGGGRTGARALERLAGENSLVRPSGPGEYSYHPMLRAALTAQLRREQPGEVPALLGRAARWHAAQGQAVAAVRAAAQAGDFDYGVHVLAQAGAGVLAPDRPAELESVLAGFPAEYRAGAAPVAAALAAARLWLGDADGAAPHLACAQRSLPPPDAEARQVIEPWLTALRVMQESCRAGPAGQAGRAGRGPGSLAGQWARAEQAAAAAGTVPQYRASGLLWFAIGCALLRRFEARAASAALTQASAQLAAGSLPGLRVRALAWQALAAARCGELAAADRLIAEADSDAAGASGPSLGRGAVACALALARAQVCVARDDLEAARGHLDEAERLAAGQAAGEPSAALLSGLMRVHCAAAEADTASAQSMIARLRAGSAPGDEVLVGGLAVLEASVGLAAGERERAALILAAARDAAGADADGGAVAEADGPVLGDGLDGADGPDRGDGRAGADGAAGSAGVPASAGALRSSTATWAAARLCRGRLLLATGDDKGALETVEDYVSGADQELTLRDRVGALLIAGVARRRLSQVTEAARHIEQALLLAEPEGAYRVFLDGGPAVRSAMTVLVPPTSRCAGFAGRVLERFDGQPARPSAAAPARPAGLPLTGSELAVLRFLPSHMTNQEIAEALFLSINTVKTHLRSAYRKLGVANRRQAIARGRRLDLL